MWKLTWNSTSEVNTEPTLGIGWSATTYKALAVYLLIIELLNTFYCDFFFYIVFFNIYLHLGIGVVLYMGICL